MHPSWRQRMRYHAGAVFRGGRLEWGGGRRIAPKPVKAATSSPIQPTSPSGTSGRPVVSTAAAVQPVAPRVAPPIVSDALQASPNGTSRLIPLDVSINE